MRLAACFVLALVACREETRVWPARVGGVAVPASVFARGREVYQQSCVPCHGEAGDGRGPAAAGLRPPPRDFTAARFRIKFAGVSAGKLPRDEDLARIVRRGLPGSAMPPFDLPDGDVDAVVHYLKTFSPRWQTETPGEAVPLPPDPWSGRAAEAIAEGARLYHTVARCAFCHPSYASAAELARWGEEPRPDADTPRGPLPTDYRVAGRPVTAMPTDFRLRAMRAVHGPPADARRDLVRIIAAGVGGTGMPAFVSPDDPEGREVWAIAYYVETLRRP